MLVQLNQLKDKDAATTQSRSLDTHANWIKSFGGVRSSSFWNPEKTDVSHFVELNKNFDAKYTHAGLISYAYLAWASERGMQLRPDMILNAIISELADHILSNPKHYEY